MFASVGLCVRDSAYQRVQFSVVVVTGVARENAFEMRVGVVHYVFVCHCV